MKGRWTHVFKIIGLLGIQACACGTERHLEGFGSLYSYTVNLEVKLRSSKYQAIIVKICVYLKSMRRERPYISGSPEI